MKISGYTTIRNAVEMDYPFEATIRSLADFCDEVVVVDSSDKEDGTMSRLESLMDEVPQLSVYQLDIPWNAPNHGIYDGMTKAFAREQCTGDFLWQMDCVPGDTKIMTFLGEKKISDIVVGDLVLTHKGRFQKVLKTMKKPFNSYELFSYDKLGDNRKLRLTGNHPIYFIDTVSRNSEWIKPSEMPDITKMAFSFPKFSFPSLNSLEINVSRGKQKYESMVQNLDEDFGFLIGTYLGDGNIIFNKGRPQYIRWCLGNNEIDTIEKISKIILDKFNIQVSVGKECNKQATWIQIGNHKLAAWFLEKFSTGSREKRIKDYYLFNNELTLGMLKGLHASDGSSDKKYFKIDLANPELISQIKLLLTKIGLYASVSELKQFSSFTNKESIYYRLSLSGKQLLSKNSFLKETNIEHVRLKKQFFNQNENCFFHTAFSNFCKESYLGELFNIEVENDNSYVANGVIIHNCDEVVQPGSRKQIEQVLEKTNSLKDVPLLALPVVEYWGGIDKVRVDINPWKWRISRNDPQITHGIPSYLRWKKDGLLYSKPGSDGCDYIKKDSGLLIPCLNFITKEIDELRVKAIQDLNAAFEYERWFNATVENLPTVYHFSWWSIASKIQKYKYFWNDSWLSLYGEKSSKPEGWNPFFDKSLSNVSDEEIKSKAKQLATETGGHIFHSSWTGQKTNSIKINKTLPTFIDEWANAHKDV